MERRAPWTEVCLLLKKECRSLLVLCIFLLFFLTAALSIPSFQPAVAATVPPIITYQGKLLESNNSVTTTKAMGFLIYDAAAGGNLVYTAAGSLAATSTVNITPAQGIFSISLGGSGTNAIATSTFANHHALYLEVVVSNTVLSPRKRISSVPFAINTEYLMGIAATSTSSSLYIPISDQFGNFIFSGNSRSTLVSGGLLYINPTSTIASGTLFGIAVNGSERFKVDANGDVFVSGTLNASGTMALNFSINSSSPSANFTVSGTVYISGTTTFDGALLESGRNRRPVHHASLAHGGAVQLSNPYSMDIQGNYAYVSSFSSDSVEIINIANPSHPRHVGSISTTSAGTPLLQGAQGISVQGNYAYVVSERTGSNALEVIDISNPANPRHAASLRNGEGGAVLQDPTFIRVYGQYAYILNASTFNPTLTNGLEIVDVSNPLAPRHVAFLLHGTNGALLNEPTGLDIQGKYVYIANLTSNALEIVDISDPRNPRHVSSLSNGVGGANLFGATSIRVRGRYAYVASFNGNVLEIVDISDPTNPRHASSIGSANGALMSFPNAVAISGDYAYVVSGFTTFSTSSHGLSIFDISSSTRPVFVASLADGANGALLDTPFWIDVQDNYAYVASWGDNAFEVIDLASARISNAEIGSVKMSTLEVLNPAYFGQGVTIRGSAHIANGGLFLGGDLSFAGSSTYPAATNTIRFAQRALFLASTTAEGPFFTFDTFTTSTSSTTNYILSVRNRGAKLFSVSSNGQLHVLGSIFASSTQVGTPGTPGDLAERVDIAPDESIGPGDVMVVDASLTDTYRKSTVAYDATVAGVISGNPTIIVGNGKTDHTATLAMIGRVPVNVSAENGPISRGDLLVAAATVGYAMRYDPATAPAGVQVGILGIALDTFAPKADELAVGQIMMLLRSGWVDEINSAALTVTSDASGNIALLPGDTTNLANGRIANISRLAGIDGHWEINEDGALVTKVALQGEEMALYAATGVNSEYILTGSGQLQDGAALIRFTPANAEMIDPDFPLGVQVTIVGAEETSALRVTTKDSTGFTVEEMNKGKSSAAFDWMVRARRKQPL